MNNKEIAKFNNYNRPDFPYIKESSGAYLYRANSFSNFFKIPEEIIKGKIIKKKIKKIDEEISYYLTEEYIKNYNKSKFRKIFINIFYILKPGIPKKLQIEIRRKYLVLQKRNKFPLWPIDTTLYEVYKKGIKEIFNLFSLTEIPFINFWPYNKKFAFVLTHDVETQRGQRNIRILKRIEENLKYHSIWNFVPEKYKLDIELIEELKKDGFEIGIHGLKHDGKLFRSDKIFFKRVSKINFYLKKFKCSGFRSPVAWRNYEYMQNLHIEYDLSYFDSDIFEVQAGGSLSFHPFFLGKFVELPYTLPQDHTLFILLGEKDDKIWQEKLKLIKKLQGMVLMLVHPDYILTNNILDIYKNFLLEIKNDQTYWHALPREVARWWHSRSNRKLKKIKGEWQIYPPLKGGSVGKIRLENDELVFC